MAAALLWPFLFFVESVVCIPSRWNVFACVGWWKIHGLHLWVWLVICIAP